MTRSKRLRRRSMSLSPTSTYSQSKELKKNIQQHSQSTLFEFFNIRKSSRLIESQTKVETTNDLHEKIRNGIEIGIIGKESAGKGLGVFTTKPFKKGEFVVEYFGDLIDYKTAAERETIYEQTNAGAYMYFFTYKNKRYCIDATIDKGRLGRLLNHSRLKYNLISKVIILDNIPRLVFTACKDIDSNVELYYDYGDRTAKSLRNYPWLKY